MPIHKTEKGWKIENTPGYSETREKAVKRLQAIKANQKNESCSEQKPLKVRIVTKQENE